jgi:hypothetical protein
LADFRRWSSVPKSPALTHAQAFVSRGRLDATLAVRKTHDCGTSTVGGLEAPEESRKAPVNPEQFASFNERWAGLVKKKF